MLHNANNYGFSLPSQLLLHLSSG